jgi:DNA (cytosine-5)-methyltransferase 1
MRTLKVGSLFAGIGGICHGFINAGFDISWAIEIDKNACKTYRENIDTNLLEKDIKLVDASELSKVDVITSGFPCQAFSLAGYRKGFEDDRASLFFDTVRFLRDLKPKAFLIENVANLVSHHKGASFKVVTEELNKLNYAFYPLVLNAKDYGNIPQNRNRVYIVGFNKQLNFTLFQGIPPLELTTTIGDILDKKGVEKKYYYDSGFKFYHKLKQEMKNENTVYQWRRTYVRENQSNLCPTLTANMGTGGHNVPLIKEGNKIRKLTEFECAKLQGLDIKFPPDVALGQRYKQVGNSVVVPVIQRLAVEIKKILECEV